MTYPARLSFFYTLSKRAVSFTVETDAQAGLY